MSRVHSDIVTKLYYNTTELCEMFGLSPQLLAYYIEKHKVIFITRGGKNHRWYYFTEVERLKKLLTK